MAYERLLKYYDAAGQYLGQIENAINIRFNLALNAGCRDLHFTVPHYYRDAIPLLYGYWVELYFDAGTRIYAGYVEEPEGSLAEWTGEINCLGFASKLKNVKLVAAQEAYYGSETDDHPDLDTIKKIVEYIYTNFISTQPWCAGLRKISDCAVPINKFAVTDEANVFDILHDLALIAGGYYWGIDADRKFYFLSPTEFTTSVIWKVGQDVQNIKFRYVGQVVNSIQLRGGYMIKKINGTWYKFYPLVRHFKDTSSIAKYGERSRRLKVPSVITAKVAEKFAEGYFGEYADQTQWVSAELLAKESGFFLPWEDKLRVEDQGGSKVFEDIINEVSVDLNAWPLLNIAIGEMQDVLVRDGGGSIYNPGDVIQTIMDQDPDPENDFMPEIDDETNDPDLDPPPYPPPPVGPTILKPNTPVAWNEMDRTIFGNVAFKGGQIVGVHSTLLTPQPNESFKIILFVYTRGIGINPSFSLSWWFYPDAGGQSSGTITDFTKKDNLSFPHEGIEHWETTSAILFSEAGIFEFMVCSLLGGNLAWRYPIDGYLKIAIGARGGATQTLTAVPAHGHQGPDDGGWAGFYVGDGQ